MRAFAEATSDYQRLLDVIARRLGDDIGDACIVRLLVDGVLEPSAVHFPLSGHIDDPDVALRLRSFVAAAHPVDVHPDVARLVRDGGAILVSDFMTSEWYAATPPETKAFYDALGLHSLIVVALWAKPSSLGTISLLRYRKTSPPLDEHDREMAQALADHAVLALSNARLLESLRTELAEREKTETARIHAIGQMRHADRLATVGKLAAGVAHEIGTPLSVVIGHAQMIAGGEVQGERVLKSARTIDEQANRVAKIVRQLLDFSRRKGSEGRAVDVLEIAKSVVELLRPQANKRGLKLVVSGDPCSAWIDQESLVQVLTNLVVNAIAASSEGASVNVRIATVHASPPSDRTGRTAPTDFVRLDVEDFGTGIPDEVLPHVFEPFFTTKAQSSGTGLGLSVVHGIVQDHRGWIDVKTVPGSGTTFSVFFPAVQPSVKP